MPPRTIVNRNDILNATITLVRKEGSANINARSIAKALNCSTKPLFRVYENMEQLKEDVYLKAEECQKAYLNDIQADDMNYFLSLGKNYIKFANEEKELYKLLFFSENLKIKSLDELTNQPDTKKIIDYIASAEELNKRQAKDIFLEIWLFIHGISTLLATTPSTLDDNEIEHLLINAYNAKLEYLKKSLLEGKYE